MKFILDYIKSLFAPKVVTTPMRVIIGRDPNFKTDKTNLLWDFFHDPPEPDDWIHTIQTKKLIPEECCQTEMLALVNGIRTDKQFCLNNPDTFSVVLDSVCLNIQNHPKVKYWSISIGDNDKWCQCDKCKAELPSDTLIKFVNRIAIRFPDKIFSTLAYYATEEPPIKNKPLSNVQIMITTIQIPKDKSLELNDRHDVVEWRRKLKGWLKLTKNICIWDYTCNFRHLLVPFPIIYQMCQNLQWYNRLGIKDFIIQNNSDIGHEFSELKSYLISELLDNPKQDYYDLIDDFLMDYYGNAWRNISTYIVILYNSVISIDSMINWFDPKEYRTTLYTDERIKTYMGLIKDALWYVDADWEKMLRVRTVQLQLLYLLIELKLADQSHITLFTNICKELGDVTVDENNTLWYNYLMQKE